MLSGGALLGAFVPGALAAGSGRPPASFGAGDLGVLNYLRSRSSTSRRTSTHAGGGEHQVLRRTSRRALAKVIAGHEKAHVDYLKAALGSKAVKQPKFDFGAAVKVEATFAATSQVLENTGVGAYFGQGFNITKAADLA